MCKSTLIYGISAPLLCTIQKCPPPNCKMRMTKWRVIINLQNVSSYYYVVLSQNQQTKTHHLSLGLHSFFWQKRITKISFISSTAAGQTTHASDIPILPNNGSPLQTAPKKWGGTSRRQQRKLPFDAPKESTAKGPPWGTAAARHVRVKCH